jgi:hypothetical protein
MLTMVAVAAWPLAASAQLLWNGDPLPKYWTGSYTVDPYFVPDASGLSEFDRDSGFVFSLGEGGNKPIGIEESNGWVNAANFALTLAPNDTVKVTYLGNTAGWLNDFGMNLGDKNAKGDGAYTLWSGITNTVPGYGAQANFTQEIGNPAVIDFWLNSSNAAQGGTYSMFYPETSDPFNTGLPGDDYSARGRVFVVQDSFSQRSRSVLVVAIEDYRNGDRDFTDWFFAIEIGERLGQNPVPEPSTYGMIGAGLLAGLIFWRRRRQRS